MGFCRRCGDIVVGPKCKCGGTPVAPVVNWSVGEDSKQDRWSKTYVTKPDKPPTTTTSTSKPLQRTFTGTDTNTFSRFPRPATTPSTSSTSATSSLSNRVSAHIASATATRPPSPLKHFRGASDQLDDSHAEQGILPGPSGSELAKVYGSILQPKESLASFTCGICSVPFPPDATIYPDPSTGNVDSATSRSGTRFLCRPCFVRNGGSKGDCPACYRPVLILKSEGGFVENGGRVWHRKCFNCNGCDKNIGDRPMVDLLGRPSCADCFDTCLNRLTRGEMSPSPKRPSVTDSPISNLGGKRKEGKAKFEREGSPALDELEMRLGISKSREGTPARTPMKETSRGWEAPSYLGSSERPRSNSTPSHNSPTPISRVGATAYDSKNSSPKPLRYGRTRLASLENESESDVVSEDPEIQSQSRTATPSRTNYSSSPRRLTSQVTGSSQSPTAKPSDEAIEEMKKRFLSGSSSLAITPTKSTPTSTTSRSDRRRSGSRSRSRPRSSVGSDTPTPKKDDTGEVSTIRVRHSASTSSLRSALRAQRTGETDTTAFTANTDYGTESENGGFALLMPDRTGESTMPLRIVKRDTTGNTITTNITGVSRNTTGATDVTEHATGEADHLRRIRPQRTGDVERGVKTHRTGDGMKSNQTGDMEWDKDRTIGRSVKMDTTGDDVFYMERMVGQTVRKQRTGEDEYQHSRITSRTLRKSRSREVGLYSAVGDYQDKDITSSYSLRKDRTGDAEVESLLGALPPSNTGNLIDLSTPDSHNSSPAYSSRIPLPVGNYGLGLSSLSLGSSITSISSAASSTGYESSLDTSSVPDLTTGSSDFSDTLSPRSTGPSTPQSVSPPALSKNDFKNSYYSSARDVTPPSLRTRSKTHSHASYSHQPPLRKHISGSSSGSPKSQEDIPPNAKCEKCRIPLFSAKYGGKFVTVPEEPTSTGAPPKRYHTKCFTCTVCGMVFEEKEGGHAVFVRVEEGACHVHCAPPERISLRKKGSSSSIPKASRIPLTTTGTGSSWTSSSSSPPSSQTQARSSNTTHYSSRLERLPPSAPAAQPSLTPAITASSQTAQPRFGGSSSCPGCHKAVSPMERGVVPGPHSSRWHSSCLVCGGLEAKRKSGIGKRDESKAGCGKKLDSAAKMDAEGGVWCRECLLLLPPKARLPPSVRPLAQTGTGTRPLSMVIPQFTGTTLARQFTGLGSIGDDADVLRQLTGGGLSPTRQLASSPTKMFDGPRPGRSGYPRPKSVIGTRSTTPSGEGRGMFLVRQLTGGSGSFAGNEFGL